MRISVILKLEEVGAEAGAAGWLAIVVMTGGGSFLDGRRLRGKARTFVKDASSV